MSAPTARNSSSVHGLAMNRSAPSQAAPALSWGVSDEVKTANRTLLNPGSVGQPRDGDPRAAWLLLDLDARFAAFRRVEYPVSETQREIHDQGLPDSLAERLALGH